jgi:NhaA family Na+:H+ antiporter
VFVYLSGVHATLAGVLLAFTIPCRTHVRVPEFAEWAAESVARASKKLDASAPVIAQSEFLSETRRIASVSRQVVPPATRLERALHPWVYFLILPLFALANSGVALGGVDFSDTATFCAFAGVAVGLVLGKPVGVLLATLVMVKTGAAELPEGLRWSHMVGAGLLAGVGFTMAIFVANLAYDAAAYVSAAKVGILVASGVSGTIGFLTLKRACRD